MNPETEKNISDLKEKIANNKSSIDIAALEIQHREFQNELLMKREQVNKLKKELGDLNLKLHETSKKLDKSETNLQESQFNLSLAVKKCHAMEDKLQHSSETLLKSEAQMEKIISERNTLKAFVEQTGIENYELKKRVDELQTQHNYDNAYHNMLVQRDCNIQTLMEELQKGAEKCQEEHESLKTALKQTSGICDSFNDINSFFVEENQRLKNENLLLEEDLISMKAKCEKLEEYLSTNPEINENNLVTKVVLEKWKRNVGYLKEVTNSRNNIMEKFTAILGQEKKANEILIAENRKLSNEIEELRKLQVSNNSNATINNVQEAIIIED